MSRTTSRNEPCTCGSGKKFKFCCMGKSSGWKRNSFIAVLAVIAVFIVVGIISDRSQEEHAVSQHQHHHTSAEEPEPWEYDVVHDRYWHPGHGHWHQGRPPEEYR